MGIKKKKKLEEKKNCNNKRVVENKSFLKMTISKRKSLFVRSQLYFNQPNKTNDKITPNIL